MAKLTGKERKGLPPGCFVFPKGTKAEPGKKKFPICDRRGRPDRKHAANALARSRQKRVRLTRAERRKIAEKICKSFDLPGCKVP